MAVDPPEPSPHDALAHTERDGATTEMSRAPGSEPRPRPPVGSAEETVAASSKDELRRDRWPSTGRYVLVRWLGAGGMGAVYQGHDPELDRPVAIKVLHGAVDEDARLRMEREARALARLSHPNVVQIYEIGHDEGRTFIVMELVRGQSLHEWNRSDNAWRDVVRVYLQAGQGLAAAHAEGLVHRDFKPHNCILGDDGRVRVLDFGLARQQEFLSGRQATVDLDGPEAISDQLTQTGAFVGTLAYVALEQLEGRAVDEKCDQFGFCVSLYEALYGERPYKGRSAGELAHALHSEEVQPVPRGRRVPSGLRRILLRGLRRDPAQRWPSMTALLHELERLVQPGRRRWVVGLLGAGLLATGLGLWQQAQVEAPRCEGAEAELHEVWNPDRRARVEAALLATALPYAEGSWERVRDGLDDYAQGWVKMHTETCEATHRHGEQTEAVLELRMACLATRRIALREAVEVLAHVDRDTVARAVGLVGDLPSLSRCEDVEALRAEIPPPEDPQVAQRVQLLRRGLARITALGGVGRFEEGLEALEPLVVEAEAIGYEPLLAELEHRRGVLHQDRGEHAQARHDLQQAFARAVEHGHDEIATSAAITLVFVTGVQLERFDEGRQWALTARAFARREHDAAGEASALGNLGMMLRHDGKADEGLASLREALAIMERVRGADHPHVAVLLGAIADQLEERGDLEGAREHLRRALELEERALGPGHPYLATHLGNLGRVRFKQGAVEEGRERLREALALYEQAGDRPSAAAALDNLARIEHTQGRIDEAVALLLREVAELEESVGPEHPSLGLALGNLSMMRYEQGQLDEAVALSRRALVIREAALGPEHPRVAHELGNLGLLLRELGRAEEAIALHRRAVEILERRNGAEAPATAEAAFDLAESLEASGQLREARALMQRVEASLAAAPGHEETVASARAWLRAHPGDASP
ncbi:MAG: serine/threonine protein kinase [Myxococcales bacterium]|nr:serine/threonine protein kinase [Myxococcales bacterium]